MSDREISPEDWLGRLEAAQQQMLAATAKIESRIDLLSQEFHRTSAMVYRLSLAEEAAKEASRRREEAITQLQERLSRIEAMLERL